MKAIEPTIVINGRPLSPAMAMTVRVAVSNLLMQMREPHALGDDEHGRSMASLYASKASEVLALMGRPAPEGGAHHG